MTLRRSGKRPRTAHTAVFSSTFGFDSDGDSHSSMYGVPGEPMSNIHANNIQHSKKLIVEW